MSSTGLPVKTAKVTGCFYDADSRVLEVYLLNGDRWRYRNVPPYVYRAMELSASKGVFYDQFICGNFLGHRVVEKPAPKPGGAL
jgi:hypothetical protein